MFAQPCKLSGCCGQSGKHLREQFAGMVNLLPEYRDHARQGHHRDERRIVVATSGVTRRVHEAKDGVGVLRPTQQFRQVTMTRWPHRASILCSWCGRSWRSSRRATRSSAAGFLVPRGIRGRVVSFHLAGMRLSIRKAQPSKKWLGGPEGQERPSSRSNYQALLTEGIGCLRPTCAGRLASVREPRQWRAALERHQGH
jgi:hypothetical protein